VNLRKLLGWLPTGTAEVAVGLVVNGLATYVFLVIPARAGQLDPDAYAVFSALWFAVFLLSPSVFFPLEQEVTRTVAERKNLGQPTGAVRRAAGVVLLVAGAGLTVILLGLAPILRDRLFDGETFLVAVLILAVLGQGAAHLVKGLLAGEGDYADYGRLMAVDGLLRAALVVVLIAAGVDRAAPYAVPVAIAAWLASAWAWRKLPPAEPGAPEISAGRMGRAVAVLAVAQLSVMILMNGIPLALGLLADDADSDLVGQVSAALILARVPLFFFQAVQASLLPELTRFVAIGAIAEFRKRLINIFAAISALGVIVVIVAAIVAGPAVKIMFGEEFEVGNAEFAALAASSMLVMLGLVLGMGLIALSQHRAVALSWGSGAIAFIVTVWVASGLVGRVLAAGLIGPAVALMALAGSLFLALRSHRRAYPYADV
jgi:O-antigen/teichoic acid export membrane protein